MTPGARVAAAAAILDTIRGGTPAEMALTRWARASRFAGSKDRAAVRDHVFDALRRWRSCAALGGGESGRARMIGLLRGEGIDPATLFTGDGHAPAPLSPAEDAAGAQPQGLDALDLPDWLWPLWQNSLGEAAEACAETLRHRAPVMLRVNTARMPRADARQALADAGIEAVEAAIAPTALVVTEGARRIAQSTPFLDGLVELQDGASQASICELPDVTVGNILDFCAGGGGKALAMAARFGCAVTAHDAAPGRMKDIPARAARAGARIACADMAGVQAGAPYGLVLTDVPCSGGGAWRRAPEGKWALTRQRLDELNHVQDAILDQAAGLVVPGGALAYATCSVLDCENRDRITAFLARSPGWRIMHERRWLPSQEGDGFFLCVLEKDDGQKQL